MNYYNMKNRKDAPEEADLCKKRCIKKSKYSGGILSRNINILSISSRICTWVRQASSLTIYQIDEFLIKSYMKYSLLYLQ
ncbi:hypothetical protein CMT56_19175 [Elizabethkingia anophelis]|nr:hypothetical protein BBD30_09530 [Elizabethkingia anophelis]MDV3856343.1 hypothetical protein [Elizabethkingia anophelis]MDV3860776.1 hypothetical protein [Elizabethkingia anophelis]MDV3910459.1 hypothetical protein [Elizabethkingia anophelis]MDV3924485.1 hypothetical protein [Elizabethkingia anophelis]